MRDRADWRFRVCAFAMALGAYLIISALVTTHSLSDFRTASAPAKRRAREPPGAAVRLLASQRVRPVAAVAMSSEIKPKPAETGKRIEWCQSLALRPEPGPVVALASFPGSGNTWLRYLMQQATGILTGSVYKDYALLKNGFPGEGVCNGSVLVVKTHEYGQEARRPFQGAVLLVRDPFASLLAEFNRRSGGHIGYASADKYKRNGGRMWRNFVTHMAQDWERMNLDWFYSFVPSQRHVLSYEQLTSDPEPQIRRLLHFLRVSPDNATLRCMMHKREGIYKRSKRVLAFDPFEPDMRADILSRQANVYRVLSLT